MIYKSGKCSVCDGSDVVLTYCSDNIESLFIESDGSMVFCSPPYEDNDLTIQDIKEDSKNDDYDIYFSCYDCEDETTGYIIIDNQIYRNAKNAFLRILRKYEDFNDFDPYGEENWK